MEKVAPGQHPRVVDGASLHTTSVVAVQAVFTPPGHVEAAAHATHGALPEAENVMPASHATPPLQVSVRNGGGEGRAGGGGRGVRSHTQFTVQGEKDPPPPRQGAPQQRSPWRGGGRRGELYKKDCFSTYFLQETPPVGPVGRPALG